MKATALLGALLVAAPVLAQSVSTDEAYRRLQQRQQEKQAAAATQPAADQIAALQTENERLRAIIADLQLQLDQLKGTAPAAPAAAAPVPPAAYSGTTYTGNTYARPPATQPQPSAQTSPNGEVQTGTTATGIPQYTGPRGGTYHYSKSGKKVYDKKK